MGDKRASAILIWEPGSTDYLYVPITNDGQPAAEAPGTIEFAFVPTGLKPGGSTTWHEGEPDADGLHARLRVGSYEDGVLPAAGKYDLYIRITADLVRPVHKSGRVTIL